MRGWGAAPSRHQCRSYRDNLSKCRLPHKECTPRPEYASMLQSARAPPLKTAAIVVPVANGGNYGMAAAGTPVKSRFMVAGSWQAKRRRRVSYLLPTPPSLPELGFLYLTDFIYIPPHSSFYSVCPLSNLEGRPSHWHGLSWWSSWMIGWMIIKDNCLPLISEVKQRPWKKTHSCYNTSYNCALPKYPLQIKCMK